MAKNGSLTELTKQLTEGEISQKEFLEAAQALQDKAVQEQAEVAKKRPVKLYVGPKKGVCCKLSSQSIRPTTLYGAQWFELAENIGDVITFIFQSKKELDWKEGYVLPSKEAVVNAAIAGLQKSLEK